MRCSCNERALGAHLSQSPKLGRFSKVCYFFGGSDFETHNPFASPAVLGPNGKPSVQASALKVYQASALKV